MTGSERAERIALACLAAVMLVGLAVLMWQRQRPPLTIAGGPAVPQAAEWDDALSRARRIDVNEATASELERLPEIGPRLAQRIVEERAARGPFRRPKELQRVRGIGPKTYDALEDYVKTE